MADDAKKHWNDDALNIKFKEVDDRLTKAESTIDIIHELVNKIDVVVVKQDNTNEKIDNLSTKIDQTNKRIDVLEKTPYEKYQHRQNVVIDTFLGIIVTFIVALVIYVLVAGLGGSV